MYTATIKAVASAKNGAPSIYCQSKSGNVYKLKQQVPVEEHARLIAQIKSGKVINIQHWIKVKEGEYKPSKPKAAKRKEGSFNNFESQRLKQRINAQQAEISRLRKEARELKNQLQQAEASIDSLEFERDSNPVDAPSMAEIAADSAQIRRAAAAKKGWETRRRKAAEHKHNCDAALARLPKGGA